MKNLFPSKNVIKYLNISALAFFSLNLWEAGFLFRQDAGDYWKFNNFFNERLLTDSQKQLVNRINSAEFQGIIPIPLFHSGSEMYSRVETQASMLQSMIYSYHCNLGIMSSFLSRTSLTETEDLIQALNSYKKEHPLKKFLNNRKLLVLKTPGTLLPDEERFLKKAEMFTRSDTLEAGSVTREAFLRPVTDQKKIVLNAHQAAGTNHVIYISYAPRKPFLLSNINDYEVACTVDTNTLRPGPYIVSFHYHYTAKTFLSVALDLIVTKEIGNDNTWQYNFPVKILSGFYPGFAVFEREVQIEKNCKYGFMFKGYFDQQYRISDFMLRPKDQTIITVTSQRDSVYNNFPG
jgi:hypothetical protein